VVDTALDRKRGECPLADARGGGGKKGGELISLLSYLARTGEIRKRKYGMVFSGRKVMSTAGGKGLDFRFRTTGRIEVFTVRPVEGTGKKEKLNLPWFQSPLMEKST